MPVRDAEPHVDEALASVREQAYGDFELLVVDDGSTDGTWKKLLEHQAADKRIRLLRNEQGIGVARALQQLFEASSGNIIARMDGDDIADPRRFQLQLQFMSERGLDVCGSWVFVFGRGTEAVRKHPVTDEEIKALLPFVAPFTHPSVMMKRELLERHPYMPRNRAEPPLLEDNDLWARMAPDARMGNVPIPLLRYREHDEQLSSRNADLFWDMAGEIGLRYLKEVCGVSATAEEKKIHIGVRHPRAPARISAVADTEAWLLKVQAAFAGNPKAARIISEQWYRYAIKCAVLGPGVYRRFRASKLYQAGEFRLWQRVAVAVLAFLRVKYNSATYRFLVSRSPAGRV